MFVRLACLPAPAAPCLPAHRCPAHSFPCPACRALPAVTPWLSCLRRTTPHASRPRQSALPTSVRRRGWHGWPRINAAVYRILPCPPAANLHVVHLPAVPADRNYYQCWVGLKSHFDPGWTPEKAAAEPAAAAAGASGGSAPAVGGGQQQPADGSGAQGQAAAELST